MIAWKTTMVCRLFLTLAGCVGGHVVHDKGVSAYVVQEMVRPPGDQHKFVQGAFSRVVLAIENGSDDVIIVM